VRRADIGAWLAERWLVLAVGLAAAAPIVVAIARVIAEGWVPMGDDALIAVRSYEVFTSHPPLVGMPSTGPTGVLDEQTFHLGPLLFWLLAVPAHFLGPSSPAVTVGLVNVACVMGAVGLARRRGGMPLMFATGVAIPLMLMSLPPEALCDIWNPAAPVMPFLLLIFLAWSTAAGDHRLLPLTVLAGSFVAQCHLIYVAAAAGALAVAGVGLFLRLRHERPLDLRPWLIATLVVGLVCWSGPLIDQAIHRPGNLVQLKRAAQADTESLGKAVGARSVIRTIGVPPWWLRDQRGPLQRIGDLSNTPGPLTVGSALLVLLGLAGTTAAGLRARRPEVVAGGSLALVLCVAVGTAPSSVPAGSFASLGYGLWWASPLGMWVWLVLGWSLATLLRPARLPALPRRGALVAAAGAVAVVAALAASTVDPPHEPFDDVRTVTDRLEQRLPSEGAVRVDADYDSEAVFTGAGFQLGIVYWLLREGRTVSAPSLPDLGSRYASPGGPGTDVVRVEVNRPPPRSGTVIGRFPVAAETSDNPFFKGPRTRLVVVSLALH
jgi:hypothetical protein